MTIQNQIPKLIIGLVMITFSYAIVGLLIDVMWVSTYFVINTLTPAGQRTNVTGGITQAAPYFTNTLFEKNDGIVGLAGGGASGVGDIIKTIFNSPQVQEATKQTGDQEGGCDWLDLGCHINDFINGTLKNLLSTIFAWFISVIATIIVFFIFLIAIVVALFKLLFALLKSFITVLLDTILAPFWILGGLLPGAGQSIGIGPWLRDVAANLAVFPAVVFLFLIARIIMEGFNQAATSCTTTDGLTSCLTFNPPLIGNATDNTRNFGALIAVGFILAAPGVVESVKKAFKASSGVGLGGAAVGAAAVGAVGGAIGHRLYGKDYQGIRRGPLVNVQQRAFRAVADSKVGGVVGNLTRPIRTNKLARLTWGQSETDAWNKARAGGATRTAAHEAAKAAKGTGGGTPTTQPSSTPQSTAERPAPRAKVIRGPKGDAGPKGDQGTPGSPPPTQ